MEKRTLFQWIQPELERLRENVLLREIPPVDQGAGRMLQYKADGSETRELLNLASNNYLGLAGAGSPLTEPSKHALETYGTSSSASRLVTGNYALYDALDARVTEFKGTQAALTVGSGFAANLAIFSSLASRHAVVFSDKLNHASIIDGVVLSGAKHVRYRHNDMAHLEKCMQRHEECARKILVTDTVFSMDGDLAPLERIVELCQQYNVFIVVDEAHAAGVFGKGRGLVHEFGLEREIDLHMGTFSKALGSYGAYLAGNEDVITLIRNKGRSFIFSTSLPPAVVGANLAALEHVHAHPESGELLLRESACMRDFLMKLGFDLGGSSTQIIPIILGDNERTLKARDFLQERGLYVAAIRPPTVPAGTARLRLSLRADFTEKDLARVRDACVAMKQELAL